MKKLNLIFIAIIALASCKKDKNAPTVDAIKASKQNIAVGQYIVLTANASDAETETSKLTFKWSATDGFTSTGQTANWQPKQAGEQVVTLTVSNGKNTTTQNTTFTVKEADFRLGLYNDSKNDIVQSESKAGKTSIGTSDTYLAYTGTASNTTDIYYFASSKFTYGVTQYNNISYTSNYSQYVTAFQSLKATHTAKYGSPVSDLWYYKNDSVHTAILNNPSKMGDAIAAGDVSLETNYKYKSSTVRLVMFKSATSLSVLTGTVFEPQTTAPTTTSALAEEKKGYLREKYPF